MLMSSGQRPRTYSTVGMPRTITHTHEYAAQAEALKDSPRFFDVQAAIDWGVATQPTIWPVVEGMQALRILRTDGSEFEGAGIAGDVVPFRVAFRIIDDNNVELLTISTIPLEE